MTKIYKLIPYLFYGLFFLIPLILWPNTSEIFEFNKMIATYIITTLILGLWLLDMLFTRKIKFKRTFLDIPILIFLITQTISTILSIDTRTSLLGYYSRFNGGLISTVCYSILYWAFVTYMDKLTTQKSIYVLFSSAFIVSVYAVLEHFGIDKNIWIQDVQNRVFSTLGQPNWLAAWIVAILPLTWAISFESLKLKNKLFIVSLTTLSALFFLTLLYTKSRSGIIGFVISDIIFIAITLSYIFIHKLHYIKFLKVILPLNILILLLTFVVGSPWTPSLTNIINKNNTKTTDSSTQEIQAPALEIGGSSSAEIRRIVWKGALDIWKHYPIFGSGVETFAFSYYKFRPVEHNLVSEWDFLYNKAHNEYLNYAATSGTLGIVSYLLLISFSILLFIKLILKASHEGWGYLVTIALLSGYTSILVTNFFGFSVVPVAILFFLYPAIAVAYSSPHETGENRKNTKLSVSNFQIVGFIFIGFLISYVLYSITKYWYADIYYARGKAYSDAGSYANSITDLKRAIKYSPHEAIFWSELAASESDAAIYLSQSENTDTGIVKSLINTAVNDSQKAINLSPANVNLKRSQVKMFINFSAYDSSYLTRAHDVLISAIDQAPTDAKLYYNLGLIYLRAGQVDKAEDILRYTINIKDNYRDARYALALILIDQKDSAGAKAQLEYILTNINPDDGMTKEALQQLP